MVSEKILVISDDHGDEKSLINLCNKYKSICKYKVHCGDSLNSDKFIKNYFDIAVIGNNDSNNLNDYEIFQIYNIKILVVHGDHLLTFWKPFNENLYLLAKKYGCQLVLHGHLHIPIFTKYKDITIISPGSIRLPRQGKEKTYCIVEITDNNEILCEKLIYE